MQLPRLPHTVHEFHEFRKTRNVREIIKEELTYDHRDIFPLLVTDYPDLINVTEFDQNTLKIAQRSPLMARIIEGYLIENPQKIQSIVIEINLSDETDVNFSNTFFEILVGRGMNPFKIHQQLPRECYEIFCSLRKKKNFSVSDVTKILDSNANIIIPNANQILTHCRNSYMDADAKIKNLEKIKDKMSAIIRRLS